MLHPGCYAEVTMMPLDVLFRYLEHPTERTMFAINKLSAVYGFRAVRVDEAAQTVRIEFDATHLNKTTVQQLLRRTGLDVVEEISLLPPQTAPAASAPPK